MPIDDLTALGQKMREARKEKGLTQQELADLSHVSIKQIAKIEKGKINPSYLILKALAKVLPISLDTLINPDVSPEDEGATQMKILYYNCPSEVRKTLLHHMLVQQELRISHAAVTLVAGDEPAVVGLFWIFYIVDDVADGLADRAALAGVQRHDTGGGHVGALLPQKLR